MRRSKYREAMHEVFVAYMASEDWKRVRAEVKARASGKCAKCDQFVGDTGIAHHEHYEHWGKANYEEVGSCVYLCKKCHKYVADDHTPFFAKQNFDPFVVDFDELQKGINNLYGDPEHGGD